MTSPKLTDSELRAMRERAEAATPGPWEVASDSHAPGNGKIAVWLETKEESLPITGAHEAYRDMLFAAHARTDVPRLLDEVARLEADNARLRAALRETGTCPLCSGEGTVYHLPRTEAEYDTRDVCPECKGQKLVPTAVAALSPAAPPAEKPLSTRPRARRRRNVDDQVEEVSGWRRAAIWPYLTCDDCGRPAPYFNHTTSERRCREHAPLAVVAKLSRPLPTPDSGGAK